ncbi:thioesterase [Paenibacillus validus]|uniref:acyl-[acyl-carrier-protein] thioesterase n=1 Tax=Paenibacillus validus TaxID=44253 RepID=UPI000FD93F99|nr:acyl-ACP thioesterase domain-containing protein [Paenibacillus validus]MED4603144.1 thioesterase [Paenibacillus validus]MED4607536.1 thioesterase [Paenibacillus validus]
MEKRAVYTNTYRIALGDVDFLKSMKLSAVFNAFQEIASRHADHLGLSIQAVELKRNAAWILTRILVELLRRPRWNEEIRIETWPQPPKKYEFERDYAVMDNEGNVLLRAVSTWVLLDIDKRELLKSDSVAIDLPAFETKRAILCKLGKIKPSGTPEPVYKRVIGISDIDVNGHLNNSKYVDFIVDCFSIEQYRSCRVKSIQVNYVQEALPGDTISFFRDASALAEAGLIYIEGRSEQDGRTIFTSELEVEAL